MRPFEYIAPGCLDEAIALLSRDGSRPIAGGTDLVVLMKQGLVTPRCLVDMTNIGLSYIRGEEVSIRIGAATCLAQVSESEEVRRGTPILAEAVEQIGSVQTRSLATLGGNLCSGVPSADSAPPLLVLEALLKIVGPRGERTVEVGEFFKGPKQTILINNEILIEIKVPLPSPFAGLSFIKLGRRKAMSLAVVNVATLLVLGTDGSTIEEARIGLGAVAPTPIRAPRAESALRGNPISESVIEQAVRICADEISPIGDLRATADYRARACSVILKRALVQAWQRAIEKRVPINAAPNRT